MQRAAQRICNRHGDVVDIVLCPRLPRIVFSYRATGGDVALFFRGPEPLTHVTFPGFACVPADYFEI